MRDPDGPTFELVGGDAQFAPCDGTVRTIPPNHQLLVNGSPQALPAPIKEGAELRAVPLDPQLAAARAASAAAVSEAMHRRREPIYLDTTVVPPKPRVSPPPPDLTVPRSPVHIRLGTLQQTEARPLPSPLKVATQADGAPIPEGVPGEEDVLDLAVDLGGGESAADIAHAARQAKG